VEGLTWNLRASRVRAGEETLAEAAVDEPIEFYERLFDTLLRTSFDSVVLCTAAGEYLAVSDSFCTLTGYGRAELLGQTSLTLGMVDPTGPRLIAAADVTAGRPGMYENVITRKDGETRRIEFSHQLLGPDYTLVIARDVTERHREEMHLVELASTDPLTGLLNRRSFTSKATAVISGPSRSVHLIVADLDNLKTINDTHGHARGDESLRVFARTLADVAAGSAYPTLVARLGGDEFALIVAGGERSDAEELITRINARLAHPALRSSSTVRASFGIGERTRADDDYDSLAERADADLYAHKRAHRP
jgi:diguanylate cyclase (GGDEF)-like protein/PAS domain S-box-containing protein